MLSILDDHVEPSLLHCVQKPIVEDAAEGATGFSGIFLLSSIICPRQNQGFPFNSFSLTLAWVFLAFSTRNNSTFGIEHLKPEREREWPEPAVLSLAIWLCNSLCCPWDLKTSLNTISLVATGMFSHKSFIWRKGMPDLQHHKTPYPGHFCITCIDIQFGVQCHPHSSCITVPRKHHTDNSSLSLAMVWHGILSMLSILFSILYCGNHRRDDFYGFS